MPSHCSLAVIVVLIPFLLPVADSVAIVKVRFLYYSNPQGLLHNGHRCDPRIYLNKKYCDPFFTITVTVSGQKFEWKTGRAKEKNTVHFGSKIVDIENPLVTRVQSYYGQLDISVKVDDFDSVTSHDYMGSFSHRFVASARPFGDLSAPQEVKLVDSGKAAAELLLQISVQCETHYYGSDCSKFCQPGSNHHSGHYLCRSDGSKICEPTYSEQTECRDKFCSSQLCHNGGTCIDLPNKFVCECQRPFGGDTCTERIAPCQHNRPCQNGGTCHAGVGCACPTGFHGDACQNDVDECQAVSPCRGNGSVCENWFGTYSCRCGAGWSGRNCTEDVDECAMTDHPMCFNGGRCENTQGSFICHCPLGFRGKRCLENINECAIQFTEVGQVMSPCQGNDSICEDLVGNYSCICGPGWSGRNCTEDIDECMVASEVKLNVTETNSTLCWNGGTCVNSIGGFSCLCLSGFRGELCQDDIDECSNSDFDGGPQSTPCHGNGSVCRNLAGSYSCICGPGWHGRNCTEDIDECELANSTTMCLNGAVCHNYPGRFECRCKAGFRGDRCQEDVDECQDGDGPCRNETQVCENLIGSFRCLCRDGLGGPNCTQPIGRHTELTGEGTLWWKPLVAFVVAFVVIFVVVATVLLLLLFLKPSFFQNWRLRHSSDAESVCKGSSIEAENQIYSEEEYSGIVVNTSSITEYDVPGFTSDSNQGDNRRSVIPPQVPPRQAVALYDQMLSNVSNAATSCGGYVAPDAAVRSAGASTYLG